MKFGVVCGLILVGVAAYLATKKKAATAAGDPAVTSDIIFTDEEAGTIEASPSSSSMRTYPAPIAAGSLGADAHRTGASL